MLFHLEISNFSLITPNIDTPDQIFARMLDALEFDELETTWALIA